MMEFAVSGFVVSIVLFLVRVVLAITFYNEATFKLRDLRGFAKNDGVPLLVAGCIAVAEGAAALSMMSGVLAQWAGIGIVLLMLGTICLHLFKWHSPYWANKRGWEYDLLMLVLAAVIVAFGAGSLVIIG